MTLSVLRLVGSLLQPLDHLDLSAVILNLKQWKDKYQTDQTWIGTYPVCSLGCCLLTAHNLPNHDHHANLGALNSEPLLGGVEDLTDLNWH